ncbi:hypothetical protein ACFW81_23900 [Streptomyces angustmyceticus]|uniref:hypothetical protein n=1 Tax=Streptomyces angustmyceticus TaxID=285578 RepID=UPI0036ACDFC8
MPIPVPVPHPVTVPQPVIIPGHGSHGRDVDIPWPWIVGYITVGLVAWIVAAIVITRHEKAEIAASDYRSSFDKDDSVMALVIGMLAGALWPLSIAGYGVWLVVQRFTRDRVDLTKEQR